MIELPEGIEAGGVYLFTWPPETRSHRYFPAQPSLADATWQDAFATLLVTCRWTVPSETDAILRAAGRLTGADFAPTDATVKTVILEALNGEGEFRSAAEPSRSSGYPPFQTIFQARLPGRRQGDEARLRITYDALLRVRQNCEVTCELAGDLAAELAALPGKVTGRLSVFDGQERIEQALQQGTLRMDTTSTPGAPEELAVEARRKVIMDAARTMRDWARQPANSDIRHAYTSKTATLEEIPVKCVAEITVTLT